MSALRWSAALLLAVSCTPTVERDPPSTQVHALFNPGTTPPTVPTPNSLAINPQSGKLTPPLPPNPSTVDVELANFLGTQDGFGADSLALATFDGTLQPESVNPQTVRVLDVTAQGAPVAGYRVARVDPPAGAVDAVQVTPPSGGWPANHTLAVVLVGGANGLKGTDGQPVVGSSAWALVRSTSPLVQCSDPAQPSTCRSTTSLLTNEQAVALEPLQVAFTPLLNSLAAAGLPRSDIPLAWTFKVSSATSFAFQPSGTPPLIPIPTDLAFNPATGTLNLPVDPTTSPANQAFVRDYLNVLNGYPPTTPGAAPLVGGQLNAGTVNATTVRVLDLTPPADGGMGAQPVSTELGYSAAANALTVATPDGGWVRGHRYAVITTSGVKAASGAPVEPSAVWTLARGAAPVATCADVNNPSCTSNLTLTPVTRTQAVQLEGLREGLEPLFTALAAQGLPREAIPVAWTFTIVSQPEVTFAPEQSVIPFPNNLLRPTPTDGGTPHVMLPQSPDASTEMQELTIGLNTLDGFSTSSPIISENSATLGALSGGAQIDPTSLDAGVGFTRLGPSTAPNAVATEPQVIACVSCASSTLPDGGTQLAAGEPEQLQLVPQAPLDELTPYAGFVTTSLKAKDGKNAIPTAAFALVRSPEPLVDNAGHSTIVGVSDAQATAAEPVRQALQPLFTALEASGQPRRNLALAWAFTTESTVSQLAQLRSAANSLPNSPLALAPATGLTVGPNESAIFVGEMADAFLLTAPTGTLNPAAPLGIRVPFLLVLPKAAPPAGGYPVAIFAHGLGSDRTVAVALADTLGAAGVATLSIDNVWHGERSSCTGSAVALRAAGIMGATDDFACGGPGAMPNPVTQRCNGATPIGRCVARAGTGSACTFLSPTAAADGSGGDLFCLSAGQGQCQATPSGMPGVSNCEGGDFWRTAATGTPVISGWNLFNLNNLFATRDNLRQQVVDFSQLVRVIQGSGPTSLNAALTSAAASGTLDPARIEFVGASLGSILGTLYNAVSPDTHRVVFNVPAGDLPKILLTTQSPSLVATRNAFLSTLAMGGITQGTPQFDDFIGITHWILDPADPINAGAALTRTMGLPGDRQVLFQYIQGDQTLPNPTTLDLIAASVRPGQSLCAMGAMRPCADTFEFTEPTFALPPPSSRHGFLLNGVAPPVTQAAQSQVSQYLTQGTVKTTFP